MCHPHGLIQRRAEAKRSAIGPRCFSQRCGVNRAIWAKWANTIKSKPAPALPMRAVQQLLHGVNARAQNIPPGFSKQLMCLGESFKIPWKAGLRYLWGACHAGHTHTHTHTQLHTHTHTHTHNCTQNRRIHNQESNSYTCTRRSPHFYAACCKSKPTIATGNA